MTTKDYVYLALLALAALVFYCHGFYAGVSRSRHVYESLLEDNAVEVESPDITAVEEETQGFPTISRDETPLFPRRELRNDFGNN